MELGVPEWVTVTVTAVVRVVVVVGDAVSESEAVPHAEVVKVRESFPVGVSVEEAVWEGVKEEVAGALTDPVTVRKGVDVALELRDGEVVDETHSEVVKVGNVDSDGVPEGVPNLEEV